MKILLELEMPTDSAQRRAAIIAARQLLATLDNTQSRAPDLTPSATQTPIRDSAGAYLGFWQVVP